MNLAIETDEGGQVRLESGKDRCEEADEHLTALREGLDVGDGDISELYDDVDLAESS